MLSPGPVLKLHMNLEPTPDWMDSTLEVVYTPLEQAYYNIAFVEQFYDWYFELWNLDD